MNYYIVLPPDVAMNSAGFVEAWNADPELCSHADARIDQPIGPDTLRGGAVPALCNVADDMQPNALYDSIKYVLFNAGVREPLEIGQTELSQETRVLTITVSEPSEEDADPDL